MQEEEGDTERARHRSQDAEPALAERGGDRRRRVQHGNVAGVGVGLRRVFPQLVQPVRRLRRRDQILRPHQPAPRTRRPLLDPQPVRASADPQPVQRCRQRRHGCERRLRCAMQVRVGRAAAHVVGVGHGEESG
eukprot:2330079-Rhodomonas_salina.1